MIFTALIAVYNEADILQAMLRHYVQRGMRAWLLDNWSNDGSYEIACSEPGVTVQRWPDAPNATFDWGALLHAFERAQDTIESDWFSLCGADHYLDTFDARPFVDVVEEIDQEGYNAIAVMHRTYSPIDNDFVSGDPVHHPSFAISSDNWDWLCDTWKKQRGITPDLFHHGGHDVQFAGRRVCPEKLLREHYPIRSQAHGERKVFQERKPRLNPLEHALGWHVHYDHIEPGYQWVK